MPVKVEILFLFLQVNSERFLKSCPCSEFLLRTAVMGESPESQWVQTRRTLWKCPSQSSQLWLCCWVILEHGAFPLGATEQVLEGFGSRIPLQLSRYESPEIEILVHSISLHRCFPVGALPDSVDVQVLLSAIVFCAGKGICCPWAE